MKRVFLLITALLLSFAIFAQSELVKSSNEFSFNLFSELNKKDTSSSGTNLFVSPFSVYNALSMAYDGSAKKTATEMRKVLGFTKDQRVSHQQFSDLLQQYRNESSLFKISNVALMQKQYDFLDSYLTSLKDYEAQVVGMDFSTEEGRKLAVEKANNFVAEHTNKKITELLNKNDLTSLTKLVLLNAIYFNANWETQFKSDKTRQKTFYGKNSVEYVTDFMNGTQKIAVKDTLNVGVFRLNYSKRVASLYIIMPNEGQDIDEFVKKFSASEFANYTTDMKELKAEFSMPKFKVESRFDVVETMQDLGMKLAFTGKADFSKMTGKRNLQIDKILHKSFIEVSEAGTEAAAATAVIVREKTAMIHKNPQITINRPFIFVIQENSNNTILFVGKYVKP